MCRRKMYCFNCVREAVVKVSDEVGWCDECRKCCVERCAKNIRYRVLWQNLCKNNPMTFVSERCEDHVSELCERCCNPDSIQLLEYQAV